MIDIDIKQMINAERQEVLKQLLDHEGLSRFFSAKFQLVCTANQGEIKGGKGALRQVDTMGVSFIEEVVKADNNGMEYRIVGSWPIQQHYGRIHLSLELDKTLLHYRIEGKGPWFIPDSLLQFFIGNDVRRAMNKLAELYL